MASKNDSRQKPPPIPSPSPREGKITKPLAGTRVPWSLIQDQLKNASSIWESDEPVKAAECQSEIDRRNLLRELRRKLEALSSTEPSSTPED